MATDIYDYQSREYSLAETKRHKPCLIYCGYRYVQDKIQNRTIYWRCEDRSNCNGRAHQLVGNESLPILTIKHNHLPIIEDLSRHDIVSVDSHRRRRRQNQKTSSSHSNDKDDLQSTSISSSMTSSIKLENHQKKQQQLQPHHAAMVKNLHLSEVITTAAAVGHVHHSNNINTSRQTLVDPIEMTKLLSNITSTHSLTKKLPASSTMDQPSRLNQFSWEDIEGRFLPVIYRTEHGMYYRYTSKMYVESTLFQSESWQRHLVLARSLPPLVSYSYTEHERKLFRCIIEWHLASFHFKTIPTSDCLILFEDLLEFYNTLRKLRDNIVSTTFIRPIAPSPALPLKPSLQAQSIELPTHTASSIKKQPKVQLLPPSPDVSLPINRQQEPLSTSQKAPKESGWVQINNVFVPYIAKIKLRDNELTQCHTRQPGPQLQREFYVPYEILIKCNICSDTEFSFKKFLIKATQQDFDILNNLITNINIFDEKVPEKTLLVNLYHVMAGLDRILYIKFLPTKHPRTQVNKYHANVLIHKGGTLLMNGNKLLPYIVQNNRFYVPLLYTFHSLPTILLQAKRCARAPRQYEIDYLNLLFIYFSIDTPPLTADTLLVDIFNIKCSNLQSPVHFRTLHEHQQYEKTKLSNAIPQSVQPSKSTAGSSSSSTTTTHKTNKCPPANVVVNPMIHHPSFYGLTSPKPVLSIKQPEIKTIIFDNHSLSAIVKSSDLPIADWKISLKNIFQQFSFDIDYHKFLQWCQTNLLLPLIKLDEEENKISRNHYHDDYYICQRHLERCIALLNDLQCGSINMTLLPPPSNDDDLKQEQMVKSTLAGAKKRKTTTTTTRHILPISTINETNPLLNAISQDMEYLSPELPLPNESGPSIVNEPPIKCSNNPIISPIVTDNDDVDIMPVVASVEEEQPLEGVHRTDLDTSFIIVDSSDGNDEKIQLDDTIPSCSSGYESSAAFTNIDTNNHENEDDTQTVICLREHPSPKSDHSPMIFSTNHKKISKKRQRYKYGKTRLRPRSIAARNLKKTRSIDDDLSLVTLITSEHIEQHLRTLFMSASELRRTRTRSVKTPTRLLEETNTNENNNAVKTLELDSNVFDILSSSTTTEPINDNEPIEDLHSPCTYSVMTTNTPNKLGLTIKKVLQSD